MTTTLQDAILRAVRRAETPSLLFAEDVELHFGIPAAEARRAIQAGHLGPWFSVDGNPAVLRESLREHVKSIAGRPMGENRELLVHQRAGLQRREVHRARH